MPIKYGQAMEACTNLTQLEHLAHTMMLDESLSQPRHQLATYASIYRDNYERLVKAFYHDNK